MDLSKFISGSISLRNAPYERSYDFDKKVTRSKGSWRIFFQSLPLPSLHTKVDSGAEGFGINIVKILAAWWLVIQDCSCYSCLSNNKE